MSRIPVSLLQRLGDQKPLIGTLVSTSSTEVAEALSLCGFEWLFIDGEHSVLDMAAAQHIIQTVSPETYGVIRIPDNTPEHFKKALETGCDGVVVPMIKSVGEAERAVSFAKYPPLGKRGVGLARAQGYGLKFADCLENANSRIALILQIEDIRAVEQIDRILEIPGVDAILIGPYDLSASLGCTGQLAAPAVVEAIGKIRHACIAKQIPHGAFCMTAAHARDEIASGGRLVVMGTDLLFMTSRAKKELASLAE